jgi:hypothetical protein
VKNSLESKVKAIQFDLENVTSQLDEETDARVEVQKQLQRVQDESKAARDKIERECQHKIDEIEDSKY